MDTKKIQQDKSESDTLANLYDALSKAQMDMDVASKDSKNPYYKSTYSDLSTVVKASRPALCKNGLSVIQRIHTGLHGEMFMLTRLSHSSGEWIESKMPINPPKKDIQGIGSYITYLRRYMYSSMVGVISGDDDDGERAMKAHIENEKKPQAEKEFKDKLISPDRVSLLEFMLNGKEDIKNRILAAYNIKSLSEIKNYQFPNLIEKIKITPTHTEGEN